MGGFQGQFKVFKDGLDRAENVEKTLKSAKCQKRLSHSQCLYVHY